MIEYRNTVNREVACVSVQKTNGTRWHNQLAMLASAVTNT